MEDAEAIADDDIFELASLTGLNGLSLRDADKITINGIRGMADLADMERLRFINVPAMDTEALLILSQLPKLKALYLFGCENITDESLNAIPKMNNLNELGVIGCDAVTEHGLKSIGSMEKLSSLIIMDMKLSPVLREFKQIQKLIISIDSTEYEEALRDISALSRLRHLHIINQRCVTAADMDHLAKIPELTTLALDGKMDEDGLASISNLNTLQELSFSIVETHDISKIRKIGQMTSLRKLEIHRSIISESLISGISEIPGLEEIVITAPSFISGEGLSILAENCLNLKKFSILRMEGGITTDDINDFIQNRPDVLFTYTMSP